MKYNNVQRILSMALLLAFTVPSTIAANTYTGYSSSGDASVASSLNLSTNTKLTQQNSKITLSLRDSDVKQVLRMFADKVGMNVVFHSSVDGKVTLDLVNMPINDAFNLVMQISNLSYYVKDNTMIVLASDNADNANFSKQQMMVFPVKYVSAAKVADFLNKNIFGMKRTGMSGVDAATVNAATNEVIIFGMPSDADIVNKVISQIDREPLSKNFAVNHTTPAEMANMICNMLLPSRGAGSGSDSSKSGSTGGAAGVVTGGAASSGSAGGDSLKLGEGVVACTVTQSASGSSSPFDLQNLAISYYPQRGTISVIGGSLAQMTMIENFIKDNDIKQPQAYVEISIVELSEQGSKEFQNVWDVQSRAWGFTFDGALSGGRQATPGSRNFIPLQKMVEETVYDTSAQFAEPVIKYKQNKLVDDYMPREQWYAAGPYISWTMRYLIENSKGRVLANPKLLVTNGQESVIDLTEDYVEKVTSEFLTSSGTLTTGAVQRSYSIGDDKGIKVTLTPFISPDGYVTMNIKPTYATVAGQVTRRNETGGTDIDATLLHRRNLDLKNVRIKDGETLVIGGLIQEDELKTVSKLPILGDLPLIGAAFRSTSTTKTKAELVIMITPKIINDGEGSVADNL